jgi:hypothetical protein
MIAIILGILALVAMCAFAYRQDKRSHRFAPAPVFGPIIVWRSWHLEKGVSIETRATIKRWSSRRKHYTKKRHEIDREKHPFVAKRRRAG